MFKSIFNVTVRTSFFFLLSKSYLHLGHFPQTNELQKMASTTLLHENETKADEKY